MQEKEELQKQGFEDWSKRDYQQLIKAYEAHGRLVIPKFMMGELLMYWVPEMPRQI